MEPAQLKTFVEEFLESMGYAPGSIEVLSRHRTVVVLTCPDDALIGPEGEHLRALNSLARRMIEKAHGVQAASFLIDINNYHERQLEHIRAEARTGAQRARLFKRDVELPPMSSYERLVVHELFAEDPDIKTESAGEGKLRHIILKYQDKVPVL